ncbi:MAG: 3-phosphoshikimate 1-carboxyvinyltransferase [Planctomycetaceae bacterium]|jgi:3-phosphoshikimate 1-carboxyvinyltransferase|nr:3-phosphoshikimate 1-carboxyvinyltransferase [Planctomycetaceae bacterium]
MNFKRVFPVGELDAAVFLPGSKSITNRAFVLAACCDGVTILERALESDDTRIMLEAVRGLGLVVEEIAPKTSGMTQMKVTGHGGSFPVSRGDIYVGNSGTSVRFLTALLALSDSGEYRLHGKPRMHERPIGDLVDALRVLGGNICYENAEGFLPLKICRKQERVKKPDSGLESGLESDSGSGSDLDSETISVSVSCNVSSQFLSGLLMAAPIAARDSEVQIKVVGGMVSRPYIEMTLGMMRAFGVVPVVDDGFALFKFSRGEFYRSPDIYRIEPDASAASYFFAAAAICGGTVRVHGLSQNSIQGDIQFVKCLEKMGCTVQFDNDKNITTVSRSPNKPLVGISVDMNSISDTAQTLGVVSLFAAGVTEIKNIGHVRYKETDRIADLATELRRFGAIVDEQQDGIKITPPTKDKLKPATVETYDDHRMAMSFAIAGLKLEGVIINDPDCVKKTFPDFFKELEKLQTARI